MTDLRQKALEALRLWMAKRKLDAVLIPRGDAYQGEEVPESESRLHYISGFTGSAGLAVITQNKAALFSDGRYTLQMAAEVGAGWTTHTQPEETVSAWLKDNVQAGSVGVDGYLLTLSGWRQMTKSLPDTMELKALNDNPIDAIWDDRPPPPQAPAWTYPDHYAGRIRSDKIKDTCTDLASTKAADMMLITGPDQLCWLLNIRGDELDFTPFYRAFAVLSSSGEVTIFTDAGRLADINHDHLIIKPESDLPTFLAELKDVTVSIDPGTCPYALIRLLGDKAVEEQSPITALKARKNRTEIEGFRSAHRRDAVAMVRFLCWLDDKAGKGLREYDAGEALHSFRREVDEFISPSFGTICGSGPNGAIVHYRAKEGNDAEIASDTLCLIDSGGQYLDATTDITRTVIMGQADDAMRADFTHVLKAHIALDQAIFPKGTTGMQLDALTRSPMWAAGMDFAHGTGHGVGCCLGVHEGPANISKRGHVAIEEGMVLSNEPGYYITGAYGIRIENLIIAQAHPSFDDHLYFEHVTLVPIDRRLIDTSLLTADEQQWVNHYHLEVREKIGADIAALGDETVAAWFDAATRPL